MKTTIEAFKRSIKIKDANDIIAFLTIEVTFRNKYPELSLCGEYEGSSGQIINHISPATELQNELLILWREKHIQEIDSEDYEGIKSIISDLQQEETERAGDPLLSELDEEEAISMIEEEGNFNNPEKVLALAIEEDITVNEIALISENGNIYSYGGREYLVCTDEEADQAQDEDFDNYIEECILPTMPEHTRMYFDEESWKDDAKHDGRGHSLNRYNGHEEEQTVNGTSYFLYRQ